MLNNEDFCRIYRTEEFGQILILLSPSEEEGCESCVKIFADLTSLGLSVCHACLDFDTWERGEQCFNNMIQEKAVLQVRELFETGSKLTQKES
jgi:hypothetical protein